MKKNETQNGIQKLAKTVGKAAVTIGLEPVPAARRRDYVALVKLQAKVVRAAIEAARSRPELFENNIDLKQTLADLEFVEVVEPAMATIRNFARAADDEVLARKARASQSALAIRAILEAARRTGDVGVGPTPRSST